MSENYRPRGKSGSLPSYGQFAQCISTKFIVCLESGMKIGLVLSGISEKEKASDYERFSLYFTGEPDFLLPESIYRLEHLLLDTLEIFLTPVGKEDWGYIYESIFSKNITAP